MNNAAFLSSILFSSLSFGLPHTYYIIIHGTWSRPFGWHMPGGDFYDALASVTEVGTVSFFLWSGENNHEARKMAARKLVAYIHAYYPKEACINIVAHSHGSNVGILASQLLAKQPVNEHRIHNFYGLATPTNTQSYMPDMTIIDHFYNLFSFNDFVQPVFGMFGREYPEHDRIANIFVTINGEEPRHVELHHPLIAHWLPSIHQELYTRRAAGFDKFDFKKPAMIHFHEDTVPAYEIDTSRIAKRDRDERIIYTLNNLHLSIRKKVPTFRFTFFDKNDETK